MATDVKRANFPAAALGGLLLAGLGLAIAWHYPFGGLLACAVFLALLGLGLAPVPYWLLLIPAGLPVVDLAPWTGWLTFEEFDLLVLALAAGAYLRLGLARRGSPADGPPASFTIRLLVGIFVLSIVVAMFRGFHDAGGFHFGWYQGYYEPMNSVRLAKSFFLALCLLPLWQGQYREHPGRAVASLGWGIAIGLGLAGLATVWERVAFTGLLDFSSDYRTTALFWEMHVGGAALDGFLALTVPFAVFTFMRSHAPGRLLVSGGVVALAGYACLTTFSRGVYLAVPLGLALLGWLSARRAARSPGGEAKPRGLGAEAAVVILFAVAAALCFPTSGYRGLLALSVDFLLLLPVGRVWRRLTPASRAKGVVAAMAVSAVGIAASSLGAKGSYLVFGLGSALTVAGLWLARQDRRFAAQAAVLAGYLLSLASSALVALHWGGQAALLAVAPICLALLLAVPAIARRDLPEQGPRWYAGTLGSLLVAGLAVATFAGGDYMSGRFSTSEHDMDTRLQHWKGGLAQLGAADWLLGKGLGRFPDNYFFAVPDNLHPGGYRHLDDGRNGFLRMSSGRHINGWGEIFRVSQRIAASPGPYIVGFDVRAPSNVTLHFEVCEKHLLYNAGCDLSQLQVKGEPGQWQHLEARLEGGQLGRGKWYAPKLIVFSVAVESRGGVADFDNVALRDGLGENLLANGGFDGGMARWFSSSDRYHMPWHMKSLFLHTLFDQGIVGLASFVLMVLTAFSRLTVGNGRTHPLAPPLAAGIAGFLAVGLFDSLIDVPRVATLFYFLLLVSLFAPRPGGSSGKAKRRHRPSAGSPLLGGGQRPTGDFGEKFGGSGGIQECPEDGRAMR